jgi:hypothetical protein
MLPDDQLLLLNKRGIFPGPSESQTGFQNRLSCLAGCKVQSYPAKNIFDSVPDWVEVRTGSKGLMTWEGAALWIDEGADGQRSCFIQLKNSCLSRLYPRDEVIAHEMVHAMRMHFDEERFEEILAYRTSTMRFRRYFGPLFSHPWEAKGFLLMTLASWVFYGMDIGGGLALFSPLVLLGWGMFRLVRSQRVFGRALSHLEEAIVHKGKALAVALRLSDSEIALFAKIGPQEIACFAEQKSTTCLRWRQIFLAYFS